ncbi:MAG: hypothetical protein J6N21_12675 [Butyrivibrio sp.]|nr:hypothetical protein [Butyrivibrio sp.]
MSEKSTAQLNEILGKTHPKDISSFMKEHSESMYDEKSFGLYMKAILKEKGVSQQKMFIEADVPEKYGYKLLSGEKKTKQRDVILRLCYAANFSIDEVQKALRIYGLPELYSKKERDAVLMIIFNERPGNILDVNAVLKQHGFPVLRTSGLQD